MLPSIKNGRFANRVCALSIGNQDETSGFAVHFRKLGSEKELTNPFRVQVRSLLTYPVFRLTRTLHDVPMR